jgi:Leucine-rich repeat (LRR) protein
MRWIAILCVGLSSVTASAQTRVQFTDWRLEAAVEAALGTANPTTEDMRRLTALEAEDQEIVSMGGLEYAVNLATLKLPYNQIRDLTPLVALAKLETLDLRGNLISQVPSLSGMKSLFSANLKFNHIQKAGGFSGLPRLFDLNLAYNEIASLSDLSNLPGLDSLFVYGNSLTSLPAFSGMKALAYLYFSDNQVRDLTPLSNVKTLVEIDMSRNQVSDLGPLSGLTSLDRLWISGNPIHDVTPLVSLPALHGLYLDDVVLTDYSPLGRMIRLQELSLQGNRLTRISFLEPLTALEDLALANNSLSDITVLAALGKLSRLDLTSNGIGDLTALTNLKQLRYVVLLSNPLSAEAYNTQLCTIKVNNPGMLLYYDSRLVRPTAVAASDGSCIDGVDITWKAVLPDCPCCGAPYYRVFRAGTVNGPKNAVSTWQTATSFRDTTAVPGVTCHYWVATASDKSGTNQTDFSDPDAGFRGLAIVHVDDDHSGDPGPRNPALSDPQEDGSPEHPFDALQKAIARMGEGATAVVHPGLYREALCIRGRSIKLTGLSSPDSSPNHAILVGNGADPVVSFEGCPDPGVRMNGFVLTGGGGPDGSAVVARDSTLVISNCLLVGNFTQAPQRGAVFCLRGHPTFLNCTVYGNGGAGVVCSDSSAVIRNCILGSNAGTEIGVLSGLGPAVTYSCVQGGWPGQGNTAVDPLFLDPVGPDGILGTGADNLRLRLESPCIDAGSSPLPVDAWDDLDGTPRLHDGVIDMGAYEYAGKTWYVDGVVGSDGADGLSRQSALRTIQRALVLASAKDIIRVYPGKYTGACSFLGKAVLVQGVAEEGGIPVLEGAAPACVHFENGEGRSSVLANCVIRNSPTAILLRDSSPTLRNLTITQNGEGIRAEGACDPCIASCIFWRNDGDDIQSCAAQYSWSEDALQAEPCAGRTAYWPWDEGTGPTAYDTVAGRAAALVGCTWLTGKLGKGISLDGLDDYVALPSNDPVWLPRRDLTIALWVFPERFPGQAQEVIFDLDYAVSGAANLQGMALVRDEGTGGLTFKVAPSGGGDGVVTAKTAVIPRKAWSHIVVTRDQSHLVLYVNGQAAATRDCTASAISYTSTANDDQVCLGNLSGASGASACRYRGGIDEVMFFERALTLEEVNQLFIAGVVPAGTPADPLFADPQGDDYHLRSEAGRYAVDRQTWVRDDSTSPCLDGGDPHADYRDEPAPNGARVDMGAYGGTAFASQSPAQ